MAHATYTSHLADTRFGSATFAAVYIVDRVTGRECYLGETRRFHTYPRMVRARAAAACIIKRHAKAQGVTFTHLEA